MKLESEMKVEFVELGTERVVKKMSTTTQTTTRKKDSTTIATSIGTRNCQRRGQEIKSSCR
ncbi:hypothetical protein LINPERHAP2_LOCUS148 [Linum perenne]